MEVGGRKSDDASTEFVLHCQPCLEDGREISANGFCKICKEFMCDPCISAHKRFAMSRNHVILTKDKMPSFYMNKDKADFLPTEPCHEHASEMIKFYCPTHGDIGCSDCIVLHHRNCKVEYLSETGKLYIDSYEYETLNENIEHMGTVLSTLNSEVNDSEAFISENTKEEIQKLNTFRAQINLVLDTRENMLLKSMKENEIKQKEILSKLRDGIKGLKQILAETTTGMQTTEKQLHQHFIHAKMAKKQLVKLQGEIIKINAEIILDTSVRCTFLTDKHTEALINSSDFLGRVHFSNEEITSESDIDLSTVEWTKDAELDVSCSEDKINPGMITSSALVEPGKCILADIENKCVKLVDINVNKVLSHSELLGDPYQVCALPSGHAAAALPNECKVQFVSVKNDSVIAGTTFDVSGSCSGLAYNDKSLFVSCEHDEEEPAYSYVERLTITGEVLQTFKTKPVYAQYITVSSSSIYVTGFDHTSIFHHDSNGSLLNTYDDPLVDWPSQSINVGKERILVYARRPRHIVLINGKEKNLKVILSLKEFGHNANNLSFCPVSRKLLVGLEVFSAVI